MAINSDKTARRVTIFGVINDGEITAQRKLAIG
jgi:hypothetical protein